MVESLFVEAGPTAVASIGAAGFLATSASAASLADLTIKFGSYLKRTFYRSMREDIEYFGFDAAMIYAKIARKTFLYGLACTAASGFVAFDIPVMDNQPELTMDYAAGGLSAATFANYFLQRRFRRYFGPKIVINKDEMWFLLAYEKLLDAHVERTVASPKSRKLAEYLSRNEYEELVGIPRPIVGKKDVIVYIGTAFPKSHRDFVRKIEGWSRLDIMYKGVDEISKCGHPVLECVALNNIAVCHWRNGDAHAALEAILSAQSRLDEDSVLLTLVGSNARLIEQDTDSTNDVSGMVSSRKDSARRYRVHRRRW